MKRFWVRKNIAILYAFLAITILPFSSNAAPTFINATRPDLPDVARGIPMGGAIRVFDLDLDKIGRTSLELKRFRVFEEDAQLIVDDSHKVTPPADVYFRGRVRELPNSIAVLAVPEQGPIRGIITDDTGVWLIAGKSGHSAPGLTNRQINLETELRGKPFECGVDQLAGDVAGLLPAPGDGIPESASLEANVTHTVRVAVETDYEYFTMFNDVDAANTYMADLFAYASTVYEREVNTNLLISWSRLWTSGADTDCAGVQGGKPIGRFCCGDGDGKNPVSCGDVRCGACTDSPATGASYCCGDESCNGDETSGNCEIDCGSPPVDPFCGDGECNGDETSCSCELDCGEPLEEVLGCNDNIDNDCDGFIDCNDSDCANDQSCEATTCLPKGAECTQATASECCSNKCNPAKLTCG